MQETRARSFGSDDLDAPLLGDADAPGTIRYFADYNCAHSRAFETAGPLDVVRERFIDSGMAKLAFVDFPMLGRDSYLAAAASRFVWRTAPGVFWSWHRGLFERQGRWTGVEGLVEMSRAFHEVDTGVMADAIRGGDLTDEVAREVEAAHAADVHATPTVVIGGRVIVATDPMTVHDAIRDALDETLAR